MELWTVIPQLIWKTNFLIWMIYLLAVVLSIMYFIAERENFLKQIHERKCLLIFYFGHLLCHLGLL